MKRALRILKRVGQVIGAVLVLAIAVATIEGWTAFGRGAEGPRRARMEASAQWQDGEFENPQPLWNDTAGMLRLILDGSDFSVPDAPLPVEQVDGARFDTAPPTGLRITWLGHSTLLLELDGHRILTDPVWAERISPVSWIGPTRWYAPPLALDALPPV